MEKKVYMDTYRIVNIKLFHWLAQHKNERKNLSHKPKQKVKNKNKSRLLNKQVSLTSILQTIRLINLPTCEIINQDT